MGAAFARLSRAYPVAVGYQKVLYALSIRYKCFLSSLTQFYVIKKYFMHAGYYAAGHSLLSGDEGKVCDAPECDLHFLMDHKCQTGKKFIQSMWN